MTSYRYFASTIAVLASCSPGGPSSDFSGTAIGDGSSGGAAQGTSTSSPSAAETEAGGEEVFDVGNGGGETGEAPACGCELRYVWVTAKDSGRAEIIKVDAHSNTVVGHYRGAGTGDHQDLPSFSVNLAGDAVILTRGGATKFYGDPKRCVESNGMPGIQTSAGAGDLLPWDVEECRAWHAEMPWLDEVAYTGHSTAWTAGTPGQAPCTVTDAKIWVTGAADIHGTSTAVRLVDGDTGEIEQETSFTVDGRSSFSAVGQAAVDDDDNLWFASTPGGSVYLHRVDIGDLAVETYEHPLYNGFENGGSLAVDHHGGVWSAWGELGVFRLDPGQGTFEQVSDGGAFSGLVQDFSDRMWSATEGGLESYGVDTLTEGAVVIDGYGYALGVDGAGYLWVFGTGGLRKVNPNTGETVAEVELPPAFADGIPGIPELWGGPGYSNLTASTLTISHNIDIVVDAGCDPPPG